MESKAVTESPLKTLLNNPIRTNVNASRTEWASGAVASPSVAAKSGPPTFNITAPTSVISAGDSTGNIRIQNCVSTVSLGCDLNLSTINFRTRNSEYNPSRFHGVIMRIREPRTTALIFRSGKLVVTGGKNEHDSLMGSKKFARIIQKLGFPVKFTDFKIQNMVATYDLRFPIKLESLHHVHGQFSSYEPELFPGLIYRMVKPRLVLLIFVNGKIVLTGAKSRQDIKDALDTIYPILRSFRKN